MNSEFIKFEPEKILNVSINLEHQHKKLVQCASSIKKEAGTLTASWRGDSSVSYDKKINKLDSESEEMARILLSLSNNLATASGIYKTGEASAKKQTETLPTEGVFLV